MSFGDAVKSGFDHYVKFDGRASRPMFWWWVLFAIIVAIVAQIIGSAMDSGAVPGLLGLALFLPGLSVEIRRLHDTGRSGWWVLIGFIPIIGLIVLIVFWVQEGDPGDNEYGPPPPDRAPAAAPVA